MPTIPSTVAAIGKGLEQLNVAELSEDLRRTVKGIERLVNSPQVAAIMASAASAVERMNKLVANADAKLDTLAPAIQRTAAHLDETLGSVRSLAASVERETVPAATEALKGFRQLAVRLEGETVPAANQLIAQTRQLAQNLEKTSDAARVTLGQVQSFAATAEAAIDDNSPLRYQLDIALREMSGAARSLRTLAAYLERHPESVIYGKNNGKAARK
jgi:paraquat-inducible protein B